jgi:NAD(P)-dependent dehydrogenase (short-subunit alcohol dehydrogenase family)
MESVPAGSSRCARVIDRGAMTLKNQVVLITGCSTGIGRALASELATRGHQVFASARKVEALAGLDADIHKLALDVTDEASIAAAVAELVARTGRVDMLVNNAGFNAIGPLAEVPLAQVRRLFDTNVTGLLAVTQAVFPHMAAQRSGRIVNIGSVVGLLPTPFAGPYCSTKAAVHMLSDVLRMEVAPFGLDVVLVQPGGVQSSISDNAAVGLERYAHQDSHYRAVHAQIEARARASQQAPMPSHEFARRVAQAITRSRAPRVVREGKGAHLYPTMSHLPKPMLDALMRERFKLSRLGR